MPLLTSERSKLIGRRGGWYRVGGVPAPVAVYQPKGAASLAASYVNLANPGTNNAAPGTAPTFDTATGWTFNGSDQYLGTGINSAANTTVIVRFSDATGDNSGAIGSRDDNGAGLYIVPRYNTTQHAYQYGGSRVATGSALTSGVMAIAGTRGYLNGTQETAGLNNTIATPVEFHIGAINRTSVAYARWFFPGAIQAVAIYSSVLTAAQVAAISTAMAAL